MTIDGVQCDNASNIATLSGLWSVYVKQDFGGNESRYWVTSNGIFYDVHVE